MATPDPRTPQIEAWSVREAQQTTALGDRTERAVWSLFVLWLLSRWYSDDERDQAAQQAAAIVEQSRSIAGNLGGSYMRAVLAVITGRQVRPGPVVLPPARRGADMTQVYARPVEAFRREFAVTGDAALAQGAARARLRQLIDTDLMLARRDAEMSALGVDVTSLAGPRTSPLLDRGRRVYTLPVADGPAVVDLADLEPQVGAAGPLVDTSDAAIDILGYRRITHPERSETGVCGLCLAAADRIYTLAELLPIHDRCQCTIAPVTYDYDPGESNQVDLEQLYADAAGGDGRTTRGRDLKNVRYQVNEHGEYGLVLSRAGDRFQRNGDAPAGDPAERARRELTALEPVLADLEARAAAGEDVAAPLTYQRNRVAKLRAIAA